MCLGIFILGFVHMVLGYVNLGKSEAFLIDSGIGASTMLIGLFNFVYQYETPKSQIPRIILLTVNALFMGYMILMIGNNLHFVPSVITLVLIVITSVQVLNHKV